MTKDEVAALKESLRTEFQKNMEAIERVEKLLEGHGPTARRHQETEARPDDVATLTATVEGTVRSYGDKRWNINDVLAQLREANYQFDAEDPYKTLHSTIWKLAKRGIVKVVIRGKGRQPNTYQTVMDNAHQHGDALNGRH